MKVYIHKEYVHELFYYVPPIGHTEKYYFAIIIFCIRLTLQLVRWSEITQKNVFLKKICNINNIYIKGNPRGFGIVKEVPCFLKIISRIFFGFKFSFYVNIINIIADFFGKMFVKLKAKYRDLRFVN